MILYLYISSKRTIRDYGYLCENCHIMARKDETLFSEVKKDIKEHLGNGKLYEVVVSDNTWDEADGKIHLYVEDDKEWFKVNTYDSYWTNAPHFFEMPERGKSAVIDTIRNIFGNDASIMALWDRGSITRNPEGKYVFKEKAVDENSYITDLNMSYFVVKKNRKELMRLSENDVIVVELPE